LKDNSQQLRDHLTYLLSGGDAHVHFDDLVRDFPMEFINRKVSGVPYTAWQVLEHMRIALWDILQFSRDASHTSPEFPKGYWPAPEVEGTVERWQQTIKAFQTDLQSMKDLVNDPSVDLFAPIAHGDGQTILREALLIADHNAYHLGTLALLKRLLSGRL
jgi:hypothetical protein